MLENIRTHKKMETDAEIVEEFLFKSKKIKAKPCGRRKRQNTTMTTTSTIQEIRIQLKQIQRKCCEFMLFYSQRTRLQILETEIMVS